MRLLCLLTFLALMGQFSFAQSSDLFEVCGLRAEDDAQLIQRTRAAIDYIDQGHLNRNEIRYLAIVVHAIHRNDGSGGATDDMIKDGICKLNENFISYGTNLQFFLTEINQIYNTPAYENHWQSGQSTFQQEKNNQVINIYIPASADFDPSDNFSVAGYYLPGSDWIVVGPNNLAGSTLAHEIGHYLSLPHPFRGWDNEFYDPAVHGEQVGTYAPGGFGQNQIFNELQDGSNCQNAADLICDTPADYNHFGPSWGCNYTGGARDPNGDKIDPDEHNLMAYFTGCTSKILSQGQIDVVNADIDLRIAQGNLYEIDNPSLGPVGESVNLLPADEAIIINNANIEFEWSSAENADSYELWIDWLPSFALDPVIINTSDTSFTFDGSGLIPNKKYFWRVKPSQEFDFCTDFSANTAFFTTIVNGLNVVEDKMALSVFPNPVQEGALVNLEWNTPEAVVDWEVIDRVGKVVQRQQSSSGNTTLSLTDLSTGIYWITGKSESKKVIEKIVVY